MIIVRLLFTPEYLREIRKMICETKWHFYGSFVMLKVLLQTNVLKIMAADLITTAGNGTDY